MTLFVCPNCGFKDYPCWRNHRHQLYTSYCHISELETFDPKLAGEIRARAPTERLPYQEGPYVYVLKPSGYVWRVTLESYQNGAFNRALTESDRYRHRLKLAKAQTRFPSNNRSLSRSVGK